MGCMTPAERASAVAFALKNCALEAMTPGEATMRAAAAYERGLKPVTHLIDVADEQTAMRLRAAADPAGKDRLLPASDDHATCGRCGVRTYRVVGGTSMESVWRLG